ncbi:MAG: hypothetical protein JXB07_08240 [Anaerolineae bacterium]|nr:hypothetical protein [Anaerolineae bacterium]
MSKFSRVTTCMILLTLAMTSCSIPDRTLTTIPQSTPTLQSTSTPQSIATPRSNCVGARFVFPAEGAVVSAGAVEVEWTPPGCLLVVQYYQNGQMMEEHFEVASPTTFNIEAPGDTELKIWVDGEPTPEQAIWITVE